MGSSDSRKRRIRSGGPPPSAYLHYQAAGRPAGGLPGGVPGGNPTTAGGHATADGPDGGFAITTGGPGSAPVGGTGGPSPAFSGSAGSGDGTALPPDINEPKRFRIPKATPAEKHARIEEVRALLRINYHDGDIKRLCAHRWGTSGRYVEKYITWARQRNRETLETSEDENLAASLAYWSKMQQDAEASYEKEEKAYEVARGAYFYCEKQIQEIERGPQPDSKKEDVKQLLQRQAVATQMMKLSRATMVSAQTDSRSAQDRIDRLKGNFAPVKYAKTTKDGSDVAMPAAMPSTVEKVDDELQKLVDQLRGRKPAVVSHQTRKTS